VSWKAYSKAHFITSSIAHFSACHIASRIARLIAQRIASHIACFKTQLIPYLNTRRKASFKSASQP
jgi:hypothetical protein